MTPERQQIVIAESCGWKLVHLPAHDGDELTCAEEEMDVWCNPSGMFVRFGPPNYLNSRDAMAEALAGLTDEEMKRFSWNLLQIIDNWRIWAPDDYIAIGIWDLSLADCSAVLRATPSQLAEAYLRTKRLWEE